MHASRERYCNTSRLPAGGNFVARLMKTETVSSGGADDSLKQYIQSHDVVRGPASLRTIRRQRSLRGADLPLTVALEHYEGEQFYPGQFSPGVARKNPWKEDQLIIESHRSIRSTLMEYSKVAADRSPGGGASSSHVEDSPTKGIGAQKAQLIEEAILIGHRRTQRFFKTAKGNWSSRDIGGDVSEAGSLQQPPSEAAASTVIVQRMDSPRLPHLLQGGHVDPSTVDTSDAQGTLLVRCSGYDAQQLVPTITEVEEDDDGDDESESGATSGPSSSGEGFVNKEVKEAESRTSDSEVEEKAKDRQVSEKEEKEAGEKEAEEKEAEEKEAEEKEAEEKEAEEKELVQGTDGDENAGSQAQDDPNLVMELHHGVQADLRKPRSSEKTGRDAEKNYVEALDERVRLQQIGLQPPRSATSFPAELTPPTLAASATELSLARQSPINLESELELLPLGAAPGRQNRRRSTKLLKSGRCEGRHEERDKGEKVQKELLPVRMFGKKKVGIEKVWGTAVTTAKTEIVNLLRTAKKEAEKTVVEQIAIEAGFAGPAAREADGTIHKSSAHWVAPPHAQRTDLARKAMQEHLTEQRKRATKTLDKAVSLSTNSKKLPSTAHPYSGLPGRRDAALTPARRMSA